MIDLKYKRRSFFKKSFKSLALLSVTNNLSIKPFFNIEKKPLIIKDPNPISKVPLNELNPQEFNGDDIERSHEALWNVRGYIRDHNQNLDLLPVEIVDFVVVGGGLSGLLSAHFSLKKSEHLKTIVLELGTEFGGNSRGEKLKSNVNKNINSQFEDYYSIGAAYITKPDPNSIEEDLLRDLDLLSQKKSEGPDDSKILLQNRFFSNFWDGTTHPLEREIFQKVYLKLKDILENNYPDIPPAPGEQFKPETLKLDQISFKQWLDQEFKNLPEIILEYFQLYCWSSFNGSLDEISAAQALNFLAAETEDVWTFKGGNSAITQKLYDILKNKIGQQNLRSGSIVLDVSIDPNDNLVKIIYENPSRELKVVKASKAVIATPKFIAKKIVSAMPEIQIQACNKIIYRPYIVANIFIDKLKINNSLSPCFDLYTLNGSLPKTPSALRPPSNPFTDICFANWSYSISEEQNSEYFKLTVYKPLPYQGARQFLFNPLIHNRYSNSIKEGLKPLLSELKIPDVAISGIRLTRWGHSMPLAEVGALTQQNIYLASKNIANKIYFANQDNWLNPSFETAIAVANDVAEKIFKNTSSR